MHYRDPPFQGLCFWLLAVDSRSREVQMNYMTVRRKLAISTWSAPREGNISGAFLGANPRTPHNQDTTWFRPSGRNEVREQQMANTAKEQMGG